MKFINFCLGVVLIFSAFNCTNNSDSERPNIIFIIVDDLGYQDVGFMGSPNILTPNLDALAKQSAVFSQAYSGCTVCAPARSTLLTGTHMGHTPVRGNTGGIALPDSAITIAEIFQNAGYVTGGFGKWGIGEIGTSGIPEKQGFDEFTGYYHQIHAHDYYTPYLWKNSQKISLPGIKNDSASYSHHYIFEKMKSFIKSHYRESFFCYAPWTPPHGQYVIPDTDPAVNAYVDEEWDQKYKNYAAMVTMIDRQVAEIVSLVNDLGIQDNTLIIFCSDNGGGREFDDYFPNGQLKGFKRDLYEGGIAVPMFAFWPDKISPRKIDVPVYFPDILPTLADFAGIRERPKKIDGLSLHNLMTGRTNTLNREFLYWEYPHYDWGKKDYPEDQFKQAVRYRHWKMIRNGIGLDWELFDLKNDRNEMQDIAHAHPGIIQKLSNWIDQNRHDPDPQIEPARINGKAYR